MRGAGQLTEQSGTSWAKPGTALVNEVVSIIADINPKRLILCSNIGRPVANNMRPKTYARPVFT